MDQIKFHTDIINKISKKITFTYQSLETNSQTRMLFTLPKTKSKPDSTITMYTTRPPKSQSTRSDRSKINSLSIRIEVAWQKEGKKSGVRAYHATPRTTRLHQRGPAVVKIESMRRYTLSRCSAARRSMRPRQIRARCTCTLVDQPSPIERPTSNSRPLFRQTVSTRWQN